MYFGKTSYLFWHTKIDCNDNYKKETQRFLNKDILISSGKAFISRSFKPDRIRTEYRINFILHREDGPASITVNNDGTILEEIYALNGIIYSELEYYTVLQELKERG